MTEDLRPALQASIELATARRRTRMAEAWMNTESSVTYMRLHPDDRREKLLVERIRTKAAEALEPIGAVVIGPHGTRYCTERAIVLLQEVRDAQIELEGPEAAT